jgi:hypothetical protein
MTRQRITTKVLTLLTLTLVVLGFWQIGSGSWIYVKARMAQVLLQRAWACALAGEHGPGPIPGQSPDSWCRVWELIRL